MSYLSRPQINFAGTAHCNPSTANNNDFADIFDVDTLEFTPVMTVIQNSSGPQVTVIDPPNQQTFPYQGATSASDCRSWLMGLLYNIQDGGPYGQQAHWNYYGDHATRLDSTTVKSVQARPGVVVPSTDPLLTATVSLIGTPSPMQFQDPVIVDNDPYALITSQIFSHGIQVTATDGTVLISASPTSRAYAYYISVFKNLDPNAIGFQMVSAVFQLAVPSGPGLTINAPANSPALIDLAAAVASGAGLQMRFCFYDAIYQIAPNDLHNSYAAGKYISNPYIGLNLGSIGVLQPGELLSAPPGRKLTIQTMIPYTLSAPCGVKTGSNSGKANLGVTPVNIDLNNAVAQQNPKSQFVTLSFCVFDPHSRTLEVTSAGHPSPLIRRADGSVETLAVPHGPVLGFLEGSEDYPKVRCEIHSGELLLLYTDGVTEAPGVNNKMFGPELLRASLEETPFPSQLSQWTQSLHKKIQKFTQSRPQEDDITLALLRAH